MVKRMYAILNIIQRPDIYEQAVVYEMKRLGATNEEVNKLITYDRIMAAISNNRKPEELAWALIQ